MVLEISFSSKVFFFPCHFLSQGGLALDSWGWSCNYDPPVSVISYVLWLQVHSTTGFCVAGDQTQGPQLTMHFDCMLNEKSVLIIFKFWTPLFLFMWVSLIIYLIECICMWTCVEVRRHLSGVLSFNHVDSRNQTQILRLGGNRA